MALRTRVNSKEQWEELLKAKLNFPDDKANAYSNALFTDGVTDDTMYEILEMDNAEAKQTLKDSGVTKTGHVLAILGYFRRLSNEVPSPTSSYDTRAVVRKPPPTPRPVLTLDMSSQAFRKFCYDWRAFQQNFDIPLQKYRTELYQCCSKDVQNSIFAAHPQFLTPDTKQIILDLL